MANSNEGSNLDVRNEKPMFANDKKQQKWLMVIQVLGLGA
jgi:hypothetical protein